MIKIDCCQKEWRAQLEALCNRPAYPPAAEKAAAEIIADIRVRGVEAICEYAEKFDHIKLDFDSFRISAEEIDAAEKQVSAKDKKPSGRLAVRCGPLPEKLCPKTGKRRSVTV
jgi:histidinol dehydrogenase